MNWILRKLGMLFSNEQIKSENIEQNTIQQHHYDKDIEARMTYKYPKGNFRFPLIPDQELKKSEMIPPTKPITKSSKQKEKIKVETNQSKRPFQPTQVPSPIYGYKYQDDTIIEFELPQKLETIVSSPNLEECDVKQETLKFEQQDDYISVLNETNNSIDINETSITNELEQTEVAEEEVLFENEEVENEPMVAVNDENWQRQEEADQIKQTPKTSLTDKKALIPYNVIMLKHDRRNLQTTKNKEVKHESTYPFPSLSLLVNPPNQHNDDQQWLIEQQRLLDETFTNFNVRANVVNVTQGPAVTRFEVHPEPGVKVNKVTNLMDDIKLSLAAKDIRIEAPIPGKNTIGIEVPNRVSKSVMLKEIIQSQVFQSSQSPLTVALGFDIAGNPIITDLKKMPHGLIAGATGSGKSVCINAMLISLMYKASPDQVKLMLIDPKMVELAPYNHIPHLVSPVITDVKAATAALKWAVEEMERRYELFANTGVRDISRYNELVKLHQETSGELPYLVIIIDELADLMMVAASDVEDAICRIAQKARACGIHLILATQRPSVDVITGLIKANIPTRIAFSVSSQVDSRTIIDMNGAERLLGKGDMLFLENGSSKPFRVQGNFVSDDEIEQIVSHVKSVMKPTYLFEQKDLIKKNAVNIEEDELFYEACEFIINQGGASTSSLQRHFRIGYNRAARLIDMMADQGIISEAKGTKPRDVLISEEELATIQETPI